MLHKIHTQQPTYCSMIMLLVGGLLVGVGCGGPSSVDAIPRNSRFKPVFGDSDRIKPDDPESVTGKLAAGNDLSFLHDDHFGCICLRPQKILTSPELNDVPWADLESQLAELVGSENSKLASIDEIWLMFDRVYLENLTSGSLSSGLPFVTVVDYSRNVDQTSLQDAVAEFDRANPHADENDESPSTNQSKSFRVEMIGDKRIVIGDAASISKLNSDSDARELKQLIHESWDEQADAQIAVIISPIRPILLGFFEMISRFGGEGQKLAQLPDVVEDIRLKVILNPLEPENDMFLMGQVKIEDDQLAKELVKTINSLGAASDSLAMANGLNGGVGAGELQENLMFTPSSAKSFFQLVEEIGDRELFSVRNPPGEIVLELGRPKALKDVVLAIVKDGKQQLDVTNRVEQLTKIGEALKSYEAKYKCLPSLSAISTEESAKRGVPAQFSWRVALLPFLGKQDLYDRFDFSKPWDAEENQLVAKEIPEQFKSSAGDHKTAFHLATGSGTVYRPDRKQPKLSDITDRKIWTAIVIESDEGSEQYWTQPDGSDFDVSNIDRIGKADELGAVFINAQFKVRIIKKDNERIGKILSSDGDERLTTKDFIRLN